MKVRVVVVVVDQTNLDRPKLALTGAFILFYSLILQLLVKFSI